MGLITQMVKKNPVITLEYGKDINNINTYYVVQNKSLQIIIKNSHAGHVRCYDFKIYHGTTFIKKEFPYYDKDSVINITSVTPDMSTRWACVILQKYHGGAREVYKSAEHTAVQYYIHVHVKGARSVNVSINGDSLNFTKTGLNVQHDGETFFSFIEHQNIELVCANIDDECKILEIPKGKASILFRTRLTSKQDKFYIDCICHTNNKYRYRTYFYKQELHYNPDKQDNILIVTVNGLLERYVRRNGLYFDYPIFKYVDGEMIIVTCEAKRPYSSIPLQFYFDINQVTLYHRIKVKDIDDKIVGTINSSAVTLNKKTLSCGFKEEYARMTFESDVADRTVRVFGLARPNILYQYRSGNVWTTVYQYSVDETISLGCVLNIVPLENYKLKWNFNGEESSRNGYRVSGMMKYADENFTKTLTEHDDKKIIKCIASENYIILNFAEVRLQLKEISNSENFADEINPHTTMPFILLYVVVSVAVVAFLICILIFWYKRFKTAKLLKNRYNNISNQKESPIPPFPAQWDENNHYEKTDEGVTQENYSYAYSNKIPKYPNLRQSHAPSENHYTEIDDYNKSTSNDAYQVVNVNKNSTPATKDAKPNEDTYDKLIRDGKPKKRNTGKPDIYAAVDAKHNRPEQQDYKNVNAMADINDSAYAYAYDTRPVAAKWQDKDRSALDYDVPYATSGVSRENDCYVGLDTLEKK
ncbi:hypothetical protein SFRURICE_016683 [Spodoptera frugiperda]|nr:hypothetical protein SFRURICE_016683 [Spodoptera frugiperda]